MLISFHPSFAVSNLAAPWAVGRLGPRLAMLVGSNILHSQT